MLHGFDPFFPFNIDDMADAINKVTGMVQIIMDKGMVQVVEETGKSYKTNDVMEYQWAKINVIFMQPVLDWCTETFGKTPPNSTDHIYFTEEEHYTMFMLRWGK